MRAKNKESARYSIFPVSNISESFTLVVSPTEKEMRAEIRKHLRKTEHYSKDMYLETTAGMFSPASMWEKGSIYPGTFSSDIFGIMFLSENCICPGYITHECLHAAMAHERSRIRFDMAYGDDCGENEERLAYYTGYCVKAVTDVLIQNGHAQN